MLKSPPTHRFRFHSLESGDFLDRLKKLNNTGQIGYSQSALLLAHNLIATIAAFQWESALPLKQGTPNPSLSP